MRPTGDSNNVVFDADFHVTETFEQIAEYLVDPYKTLYERKYGELERGKPYPSAGWFSPDRMGKRPPIQVTSKTDVVEAMDEFDIDYALVQPSLNLHLGVVHHDELATALAHAYNEWLLDEILDVDEGIYGSILVAPQRPKNAAAEIEERKDHEGFVSTLIPSGGVHPPLGDRRYQPIYEASETADLPVVLHNAVSTIMMAFPLHFQGYSRNLTNHALLHPMQHMSHLASIIVQGIPVRYPDLQIVIQEAGVGWIPFMMRRLDNEYLNHRSDAPMLEEMPSDYIRRQFYFTTQPFEGHRDQEYVNSMIDLIGPDNVLFSTDYPHFDFDNTGEVINRLRQLSTEDRERIVGSTALELFEIDHDV